MIVLGKIVGAYGLRGSVKIHPFADDPAGWARLRQWWLGDEGCAAEQWVSVPVIRGRLHGDTVVADLHVATDRDAAEALKGKLVGVPRGELLKTGDGEYYWADLIGLAVVNTHDETLGHVLGLIGTAANDVLRVGSETGDTEEGKERLLPFVASVVLDVDLAARRIRVEWERDW